MASSWEPPPLINDPEWSADKEKEFMIFHGMSLIAAERYVKTLECIRNATRYHWMEIPEYEDDDGF